MSIKEKTKRYISKKWGSNPKCPMCNTTSWTPQDKLFQLREYQGAGVILDNAPPIPFVVICCDHCGNSIMINAVKAEVVKK